MLPGRFRPGLTAQPAPDGLQGRPKKITVLSPRSLVRGEVVGPKNRKKAGVAIAKVGGIGQLQTAHGSEIILCNAISSRALRPIFSPRRERTHVRKSPLCASLDMCAHALCASGVRWPSWSIIGRTSPLCSFTSFLVEWNLITTRGSSTSFWSS